MSWSVPRNQTTFNMADVITSYSALITEYIGTRKTKALSQAVPCEANTIELPSVLPGCVQSLQRSNLPSEVFNNAADRGRDSGTMEAGVGQGGHLLY